MKIRCRCGAIYQIKEEHAGKKMKCRKCEHQFIVPANQLSQAAQQQRSNPKQPQPLSSGSNYWLKTGEGSAPEQQRRRPRPKTPAAPKQRPVTKAEKDDALLKHYSSGSSLEERVVKRRKERIENGRISNGILFILKGLGWFAGAAFFFWVFDAMEGDGLEGRGRVRIIVLLLYYLKAKYWLPPTIALIGFYHCLIGIGSLMGRVDIDDQDDLPEYF